MSNKHLPMIRFCKYIAIVLAVCMGFHASAQTLEDSMKANLIKGDFNFIYGEGYGDTPAEASQMALQALLSNIGLSVQHTFHQDDSETSVNNVIDSKTYVKSVLNSYSQATLANTQSVTYLDKKNKYYHLRYMARAELDRMFAHRMDRIEEYVRNSLRSEKKGRVDDALRYLNSAYILVHSLQFPHTAKMDIEGEKQLLMNFIPAKMKEIMENVEVSVAGVDEENNTVDVFVTYKGEPAAGADFKYWDGNSQSELNHVKDGISQLSFQPGYNLEEVILEFETSYAEASRTDREMDMLIGSIKPYKVTEANKKIGIHGRKLKSDKEARTDFQAQVAAGKKEGVTPLAKKDTKQYDEILSEILKSVKDKGYKPDTCNFTKEGLDMFRQLLAYGNATLLGKPDVGYYPFGERVVARSVPMKFDFKNNNRSFVEDVTFTFSQDRKIESVAFGLGSAARNDIFRQGEGAWSDSVKMTIVTFLENYKTAFALKRFDYINSIFDENAYIIVGHKLQPAKKADGDMKGLSFLPKYEYVKKSKSDYMKQLKKCFDSNEFVNVNFADNDVQKSAYGGDTFGIQIRQDYHSQHYGDQGYLFLFVDLNDADRPIIKIRTWQPERNGDLTPMVSKSSRDYGIYSNSLLQ